MSSSFFADLKPGDRIEVKEEDGFLDFGGRHTIELILAEGSPSEVAGILQEIIKLLNAALALSGHSLVLVEVRDGDEVLFGPGPTFEMIQEVCNRYDDESDYDVFFDRYVFEYR